MPNNIGMNCLTCSICHVIFKMSAPLVNKMERKQLQFVAFNSFLDSGFWHKLSENKLDVYGLDESKKEIKGFYFNGNKLINHSLSDTLTQTPSLFGTAKLFRYLRAYRQRL